MLREHFSGTVGRGIRPCKLDDLGEQPFSRSILMPAHRKQLTISPVPLASYSLA